MKIKLSNHPCIGNSEFRFPSWIPNSGSDIHVGSKTDLYFQLLFPTCYQFQRTSKKSLNIKKKRIFDFGCSNFHFK